MANPTSTEASIDTAADHRITAQVAFLTEADRLKTVLRATRIHDGTRPENAAEHSWHIALYALILGEHAAPGVQIDRVIRMLLLHDLVEIDTGDTPIHAANGQAHGGAAVLAAEQAAADRLFGLLPPDQAAPLRALWEEFEAAETPDAVFAKSVDRVQPVIANLETGGGTWPTYNVTRDQLESRVGAKVMRGAPAIWAALRARVDAWFATPPEGM
jgi:putative hydrolases of HD superfamily